MDDFKLKHLITTGIREAEMIEALLEDNEIEVIIRHDEFGDYSMLYMGFTAYNIELYVAEEDYEQAKNLLNSLNIETELEADIAAKEATAENDQKEKNISYYLALAAKIIIIIYLLFNLAALIF